MTALLIATCSLNHKMSFSLQTCVTAYEHHLWIFAATVFDEPFLFSSHEALMLFQEKQSDMSDILSVNVRRLKVVTVDLWA